LLLELALPKHTQQAASETRKAASSINSEADELASIVDLAPLSKYTYYTNNTIRAEKRRREKLKARQEQKWYELELLALIAGDETLPKEQAAYTSITQLDKKLVAWIIKQLYIDNINFFIGAKTLYYTACLLLKKARAIGNASL
jgi:hypothetical protein